MWITKCICGRKFEPPRTLWDYYSWERGAVKPMPCCGRKLYFKWPNVISVYEVVEPPVEVGEEIKILINALDSMDELIRANVLSKLAQQNMENNRRAVNSRLEEVKNTWGLK
jgi:hypothetical protein